VRLGLADGVTVKVARIGSQPAALTHLPSRAALSGSVEIRGQKNKWPLKNHKSAFLSFQWRLKAFICHQGSSTSKNTVPISATDENGHTILQLFQKYKYYFIWPEHQKG
jgi:hypothetical protein